MKLLLASGNAKKLAELRALCAPLGVEVVAPADVGGLPEVIEDGEIFASNAAKKAVSGALNSGLMTLSDDSGLRVDALGRAPGVLSARYAGAHGDDEANNRKLLAELADVPDDERGAEFVCALSVARPGDGEVVLTASGRTRGTILRTPEGEGGFGYDPLFRFTEPGHPVTGACFATLSAHEKASVSHRGRALRSLEPHLATTMAAHAGR